MIITRGRLTCGYKVAAGEMLRLTSSKLLDFFGTNLQNNTESLMSCVVPDDGCIFIQPDQAGAEALIVAYECRPGRFRKLFELGIKPHSYMALQLFTDKFRGDFPPSRYKGVDPAVLAAYPETKALLKAIKDAVDEYFLGKKTIHSFNYDEGPQTFRLTTLQESEGAIVLTFAESKNFKTVWIDTFPEITEWQGVIRNGLVKNPVLRNLFGYPRRFNRLFNDELVRQALAYIPQSTVGCITHLAYAEIWQKIRREKLPWQLLNNKHDSLLLQVPDTKEHIEAGIEACKNHLGRELTSTRGEQYRMKVGISVGYNWGKHHEKRNPNGLKEL